MYLLVWLLSKLLVEISSCLLNNLRSETEHIKCIFVIFIIIELNVIERLFNHIQIRWHFGYLGQGAYSVVYKVERQTDKKLYALKKVKLANLSEKEIENALNEVRILASIKNNNIIGYKEAFL